MRTLRGFSQITYTEFIVAGLFAASGVLLVMKMRQQSAAKKAREALNEMNGLVMQTRAELVRNDCKAALSNAGKSAVVSGAIEGLLVRAPPDLKRLFSEANAERMKSRDELAVKCFK
jgi:hypothetical protein